MDPPVLLDVSDHIATVTLNRPEAGNALSSETLRLLVQHLDAAEADAAVSVIILTGADPAFCCGFAVEAGAADSRRTAAGPGGDQGRSTRRNRGPFPPLTKPLIGAINGAAITGGLELALNCDFLIASERAEFADTHAREGVMPGWGLTVLLPDAIGVRRAREISFTGDVLSADEAHACGLVNHVVAHHELLPFTRRIAAGIADNDQAGVRQLRATYDAVVHDDDAWETEARDWRAWQRNMFSADRAGRTDPGPTFGRS
jgi:enoyl-CoA hydratase